MVTSEMVSFGRVTIVWGDAEFNMAVSTKELKASHSIIAVEKSIVPTMLASGAIGVLEMEP